MRIIQEKETGKKAPALPALIIGNSDGKMRYGGRKKGAYRIQRTNPDIEISAEEILQILKKSGIKTIRRIPPGAVGAASGRFNTWVLQLAEQEFSVVFGQGRNAGQKYEDEVLADLQSSRKKQKERAQSELYRALISAFGLKSSDIAKITKASSRAVKRPITDQIEDVGAVISDINIVKTDGDIIYISLKNENGATFANSGYHGGFEVIKQPRGKNGALLHVVPGTHPLDDFIVDTLGVDKQKAADGLNAYLENKPITWPFWKLPTTYNKEKLAGYLASAYGYGYWYVRPSKTGGYQIVNIATPADAVKKVGKINSVLISYPYYVEKERFDKKKKQTKTVVKSSKQITAWIDTTTATYIVEVRNSHRGINPNEIKVKVTGLKL